MISTKGPTTDEIVEVLRQAEEYLRHPDIQAIPFALSAAVPLANVRKLKAVMTNQPPEDAPQGTLAEKLRWARAMLNIHSALTDGENEKVKRRIVKICEGS